MEFPDIDVPSIAQGLKVRQKLQRPTLLFLGARAGALYHSNIFYDTLAALSKPPFDTLDQVEKFQSCIRLLEEPQRFSNKNIHYILLRSLQNALFQQSDQYVAALAKQQFFQLIVTTNIDTGLEAALDQNGLSAKEHHFDVFIPNPHSNSLIPSLSINDANKGEQLFKLVKFYGELAIHSSQFKQETIASFEEDRESYYNLRQRGKSFEEDKQLYQQLRNMRNWNILMVGFDPVWDAATIRFLLPSAGKLWYVNEEIPSQDSRVYRYLQTGNVQCLLGMNSQKFFESLHQYLVGSTSPSLVEPLAQPSPAESGSFALSLLQTERRVRHVAPTNRTKSLSPTQPQVDVLLVATNEHKLTPLLKPLVVDITQQTTRSGIYYDLGQVGDARVSLVQANNTEDGPDILSKQIRELSPACIIILGLAWGFKYKGQEIGNLLIPDRILIHTIKEETHYEPPPDAGTDAYLSKARNQKITAFPAKPSNALLRIFKSGDIILSRIAKKPIAIKSGPLFSSTDTIEPQTAFRYISKNAPNVIGIEKGDGTLFSLAQSQQKNCALVKGISALIDADDATQQKMPDSRGALDNAIRFVLQVIALGGFHDPQRTQ